jgi:hypothetical protein
LGVEAEEVVGDGFVGEGEFDFFAALGGAAEGIGGDGGFKGGETLGRIVEIGDGFDESRAGEIGDEALEFAKFPRGLISLIGSIDDIEAGAALDEVKAAPISGLGLLRIGRLAMECLTFMGSHERERAAVEIRAWFVDETSAKVGANAIDIFHERDRVAENAVVDALDDVATLVAIVLEAGGKGIVDESVAEGAALDEGSFDAKGAADVFEAHGDIRV